MANPDVLEEKGKTVVLLGNEAIVRGALEAGMGFAASFPGTPSSEVGLTLAGINKKQKLEDGNSKFYYEWSTNEKVAFEAAAGAAFSGVKALTSMKHFGFNVACDSVFPVVYTGVKGSLVIMVSDDPEGYSSAQTEEDSRYFSKIGYLPTLEPSNVQECKDFTKLAFEISEKYEIPVMLRTTTRVSHAIGQVKLDEIKQGETKGKFEKDFDRYYNLRPGLQKLHTQVLDKIKKIEDDEDCQKLNLVEGSGKIGIITNGVSYQYTKELGLENIKLAKIGITYPLNKKFFADFIKNLDKVIVVEELEPVIEDFVQQIAKEVNPELKIHGKDILPRVGEFSSSLILEKINPVLEEKKEEKKNEELQIDLPQRKPVLCAGCPHRSTFYALKKVLGEDVVWSGDIGCYMLGVFEPFKMADFLIAMGAGEGIAHGIKQVSDQRVVSFIGDGTFYHAGIPPLLNMKNNDSKGLVVIMDNSITAMTGHQPNPGNCGVDIEKVVKSFGIENVKVADAFKIKELEDSIKELTSKDELGVLIAKGECRLLTKRKLKKEGKKFPVFEIEKGKLDENDKKELEKFSCPAIDINAEEINQELCWGCVGCAQLCPGKIKIKTENSENNN